MFLYSWLNSPQWAKPSSLLRIRDYTQIHRTRYDSSRLVIGPSQRHLPDSTQNRQPSHWRDSNQQSQQASGRRQTVWSLGYNVCLFVLARQTLVDHGLLIHEVSIYHTQRSTTVGRTPLDEWSARRRDLYLTTHNTHSRQISMPPDRIRTQNLSKRATADLCLRPSGHLNDIHITLPLYISRNRIVRIFNYTLKSFTLLLHLLTTAHVKNRKGCVTWEHTKFLGANLEGILLFIKV